MVNLNKIMGFAHDNRGVGIRNHQLILPSVICSTHVSRRIANEISAVTFSHQHGCGIIGEDVAGISDFFAELADHPNVSSVLIVSLGCETIQGQELGAKLSARNKSTRYQIIQESGGVEGTIKSGIESAHQLRHDYGINPALIQPLRIGIDSSRDFLEAAEWIDALVHEGCEIVHTKKHRSSTEGFSELMAKKVHLIISFPDESQPPSGFPLIPVINVQGKKAMHSAFAQDFDLTEKSTNDEFLQLIQTVAEGKLTISEKNKSGEIRAPRIVRSV